MKWMPLGWALMLGVGMATSTWAERSHHRTRHYEPPVVQRSCGARPYPVAPSVYGRGYTPSRMVRAPTLYAPRVMAKPGYWVWQEVGCGYYRRVWQPVCAVPVVRSGSYVVITRW